MSKRGQQAVSVAELQELEALGVASEPVSERAYPIPAGHGCEWHHCTTHGVEYLRQQVNGFPGVMLGQCEQCKLDAKVQAEADEYLRSQDAQAEIARKVAEGLTQCEREIMADADALLERHLAEYKPDALAHYQNECRTAYAAQIRGGIEDELRAEYLTKVKA